MDKRHSKITWEHLAAAQHPLHPTWLPLRKNPGYELSIVLVKYSLRANPPGG